MDLRSHAETMSLSGRCAGPGPLAPGEDAVYQWLTLVARAYLDPAAALSAACAAQATEKPPSTKMV